jgi:hypothetical protein
MIDACDMKHTVCKYTKKRNADPTTLFLFSSNKFDVLVKLPMYNGKHC